MKDEKNNEQTDQVESTDWEVEAVAEEALKADEANARAAESKPDGTDEGTTDDNNEVVDEAESKPEAESSDDESTDVEEYGDDDFNFESFDDSLGDDDENNEFDEKINDVIKSQSQRIERLEKVIDQYEGERSKSKLSKTINSLDDSYKKVYDGEQGEQRREELFEEINVLRDVYKSRGKKIPPQSELVERATKSLFFDEMTESSREGRDADGEDVDRTISRPTSAGKKPADIREAARRWESEHKNKATSNRGKEDFEL